MGRWRNVFRRRSTPQDEIDVAAAMQDLAEGFVRGMVTEGEHFTWVEDDVDRLDIVCDRVRSDSPPPDLVHSVVLTMGAYLGELLVRHASGQWVQDGQGPAVLMPNGLQGYPLAKVHKRLTLGPEHSLAAFYRYTITKQAGPGDVVTEVPRG